MKKSWLITCLINFCLAILMAIGLRSAYVFPTNFNYTYLLHSHSHTVILGWCYLAVYTFIVANFIPKKMRDKPKYNRLFWLTEISVLGMAITFPITGYALFSIVFSTLHILCSYYFVFLIFKDHKSKSLIETKLLHAALIFMAVSTIGVWFLGPIASTGAKDSPFYNTAIQFFLHFQFNGWFILAVFALFIHKVQRLKISLSQKTFNQFYLSTVIGIVLTFALPLSWYFDGNLFRTINSIGLLFQFVGMVYFVLLLKPHIKTIFATEQPITKFLYYFAFSCLFLKIIIQSSTAITELAIASHAIRNFTVGFIHLAMIGVVNSFLFAFITQTSLYGIKNKIADIGIMVFLLGFTVMEYLLFSEGLYLFMGNGYHHFYYVSILIATTCIGIGLLVFMGSLLTLKTTKQ
ncbi:hypothetical protein FLAN108750_07430 [Flavobacterium antarcticum]|uniref:hypothetical protein n=1 Tax=Flavobacterium antarcticum TaxID=271155 RepID=UPI0003B62F14|nr:hypothetical protein [Flavobacterium antarcticum]